MSEVMELLAPGGVHRVVERAGSGELRDGLRAPLADPSRGLRPGPRPEQEVLLEAGRGQHTRFLDDNRLNGCGERTEGRELKRERVSGSVFPAAFAPDAA